MEYELKYIDNGWEGYSPIYVPLDRQVEDIEEFGTALKKFLKWKKKELPFQVIEIKTSFYYKRWNGEKTFFREGAVIILLKKLSRWEKFRKNGRGSKKSIVIDFEVKNKNLMVFQEMRSNDYSLRYRWTINTSQIKSFIKLLEKFTAGYWLGIHTLVKEE